MLLLLCGLDAMLVTDLDGVTGVGDMNDKSDDHSENDDEDMSSVTSSFSDTSSSCCSLCTPRVDEAYRLTAPLANAVASSNIAWIVRNCTSCSSGLVGDDVGVLSAEDDEPTPSLKLVVRLEHGVRKLNCLA